MRKSVREAGRERKRERRSLRDGERQEERDKVKEAGGEITTERKIQGAETRERGRRKRGRERVEEE
jgi:hypothetical protein